MSSSFSRIYSFVPPEKSTIFTFWLTLILFSEIPFIKESLVNTILFFLLEGSAGVLFFCFELELELDFLLAVSNTSSFSVTVFFFGELVLLVVSLFYFNRKFMTACFSISSFSKLHMPFFKISNSNVKFSLLL